jgi:hypothetical protein
MILTAVLLKARHVPDVAGLLVLRRKRRAAGVRRRARHRVGRDEVDERLVSSGDLRGRVLRRHQILRRQGRGAIRVVRC